jgi:hypothetical protein
VVVQPVVDTGEDGGGTLLPCRQAGVGVVAADVCLDGVECGSWGRVYLQGRTPRCRANKFPCCCQSGSRNCTSPCTRRGAFLPPPRGWGGCSNQRGLTQRDPLSTLSKFRTRQRTRQLFCVANAESPALAGLYFCYCCVFLWLRGRTAYNVARPFSWLAGSLSHRERKLPY